MKREDTHINAAQSNVIKIDFRKDRLSIDFDPYFNGVREIHCRTCLRRKPREGAIEIPESWGYLCKNCRDDYEQSKITLLQGKEKVFSLPAFRPTGNENLK